VSTLVFLLQSNLKTDNWSKEEDDHLVNLVEKYGKKWKIISEDLPERSPVSIKTSFAKWLTSRL
jgi:hypothetical protein